MKMEKIKKIEVAAPSTEEDREWLRNLWLTEWGGETMISKGKAHHFRDMYAVIAWADGIRVGGGDLLSRER